MVREKVVLSTCAHNTHTHTDVDRKTDTHTHSEHATSRVLRYIDTHAKCSGVATLAIQSLVLPDRHYAAHT